MNNMESKKITRNQLYNLVWSKQMTAQEFVNSDTALRKKCIKHIYHYAKKRVLLRTMHLLQLLKI